jgi:hypothetical protein
MLLLKCNVLGVEELPARDGFNAAAMVEAWSEGTKTLTMWAPAEVADELRDLGSMAPVVLELRKKDLDLYAAPKEGAKPMKALRLQVLRVHRAGE